MPKLRWLRIAITVSRFVFNVGFFGALACLLLIGRVCYLTGSVAGLPLTSQQWGLLVGLLVLISLVVSGLVVRQLVREYLEGVVHCSKRRTALLVISTLLGFLGFGSAGWVAGSASLQGGFVEGLQFVIWGDLTLCVVPDWSRVESIVAQLPAYMEGCVPGGRSVPIVLTTDQMRSKSVGFFGVVLYEHLAQANLVSWYSLAQAELAALLPSGEQSSLFSLGELVAAYKAHGPDYLTILVNDRLENVVKVVVGTGNAGVDVGVGASWWKWDIWVIRSGLTVACGLG